MNGAVRGHAGLDAGANGPAQPVQVGDHLLARPGGGLVGHDDVGDGQALAPADLQQLGGGGEGVGGGGGAGPGGAGRGQGPDGRGAGLPGVLHDEAPAHGVESAAQRLAAAGAVGGQRHAVDVVGQDAAGQEADVGGGAEGDGADAVDLQDAGGLDGFYVVSADFGGDSLNKLRGTFNCVAVKAPGFGDRRKAMLQDIAILTGGTVVTEELGYDLKEVKLSMLGQARRVQVGKEETVIVNGNGDSKAIEERIAQIKKEIELTESEFDKEKLQERLAKLSGGVAVIQVGAATEVELKERKLRLEDALAATRAAVEEGIVSGGGTVLLNVIPKVKELLSTVTGDEKTEVQIIVKTLKEPAKQIEIGRAHV